MGYLADRVQNGFQQSCLVASLLWLLMAGVILSTPALANDLPEPKGDVILTVAGRLSKHNGAGEARFDREMLAKLGMHDLTTHTIYSKTPSVWSGVLVRDVLDLVGAKGKQVELFAIDDYRAVVPISDYYDYDVILAMKKNGKQLTIRSRGPTRIIYPLDQNPELKDKKYAVRYIWQIRKLIVK